MTFNQHFIVNQMYQWCESFFRPGSCSCYFSYSLQFCFHTFHPSLRIEYVSLSRPNLCDRLPSTRVTPFHNYGVIRLPVKLDVLALLSLVTSLSLCVEFTGTPKLIYHMYSMRWSPTPGCCSILAYRILQYCLLLLRQHGPFPISTVFGAQSHLAYAYRLLSNCLHLTS